MGFFKWIKKREFDSSITSVKKRQKEHIMYNASSDDRSRLFPDEAYTEALFKFNEWRSYRHQYQNINKNNYDEKSIKKKYKKCNDPIIKDLKGIIQNDVKYEEIYPRKLCTLFDNYNENNTRHSFYIGRKKPNAIKTSKKTISQDTKIYENELLQFEKKNCKYKNHMNFSKPTKHVCKEDSYVFKDLKKKTNYIIDLSKIQSKKINKENPEERTTLQKTAEIKSKYQIVINKHGDLVEYALPYNEYKNPLEKSINESELITNDKDFNDKLLIITDLDKSDGSFKKVSYRHENYFEGCSDLEIQFKNYSEILSANLSDIQILPLDSIKLFSSKLVQGIFRSAHISQLSKENINTDYQDAHLLLNIEKLRYLRHPYISLLMGITIDCNKKINSLIFEPFFDSLNNEIYNSNVHMTIKQVVSYIIQLTNAICYCHENGMIHSNICSQTIMISSYEKKLKISCFELASLYIDKKDNVVEQLGNDIPQQYLPFFIGYRKQYSAYYYQPPELISTEQNFVFPSEKSDVYGICMTLWEMLNKSLPFQFLEYKDLVDLFSKQNTMLPIFEVNRCKFFKNILEKGLQINLEHRLESSHKLLFFLECVNEQISFHQKLTNFDKFSSDFKESDKPEILENEKTNHDYENDGNFFEYNYVGVENAVGSTPYNDIASKSDLNHLEINENVSIKETPDVSCAYNGKIKKTVWNSEDLISPIKKADSLKKKINININLKRDKLEFAYNQKFKDNSEKNDCFDSISTSSLKYENLSNSTPNETINNKVGTSNKSFENSLWKQEKMKCDNNKNKHSINNNSVKATVDKFESFFMRSNQKYGSNTSVSNLPFLTRIKLPEIVNPDHLKLLKTTSENESNKVKNNMEANNSLIEYQEHLQPVDEKIYKSNLDIILENKNSDHYEFIKKNKTMTLKFDNINYFLSSSEVKTNNTENNEFKSLGSTTSMNSENSNWFNIKELLYFKDDTKGNITLSGKLICRNCGCNMFVINDVDELNKYLIEK